MKDIIKKSLFHLIDWVILPFSLIYLPILKCIRKYGITNFSMHDRAFKWIGVFPIRDHYYEPKFIYEQGAVALDRQLQINYNIEDQLALLTQLAFTAELNDGKLKALMNNSNFGNGDAEMYYLLIRNLQPKRIIEIGCGFSTLIAVEAIKKNKAAGFATQLTCIEPYEFDWLDAIQDITLIRKKVEDMPVDFFATLESGDILFIDSSHIIRPGNDVLFEYLHLLPVLKKGVLVHIHDIFTPNDYPSHWIQLEKRFWNEQYLLEAFLYYNNTFAVKLSLNLLKHTHYNDLNRACEGISTTSEPASFWLEKIA